MSGRDPESITIHSTWRSILLGGTGAATVATAGTWAVAEAGFTVIPTTIFTFGWILVLVMLVDFPIATRFTSEGCERRMVLRRHWIPWDRVDQLTRTRPSWIRVDRKVEHGGLAAKIGRRRYLLVDRCESDGEFDRLVDIVEVDGRPGERVGASRLLRPGGAAPPTWLYRRRIWRPDATDDR
jgi:hypothetical protein